MSTKVCGGRQFGQMANGLRSGSGLLGCIPALAPQSGAPRGMSWEVAQMFKESDER